MSGTVGLPNNVRGNIIGGWVGISGGKAKLISGWVGDSNNHPKLIYTADTPHDEIVFTQALTSWTVPSGVTKIDIFCLGGAGGGCLAALCASNGSSETYELLNGYDFTGHTTSPLTDKTYSASGGSGYTNTVFDVAVTAGETLTVAVGGAGAWGQGRVYRDGAEERAKVNPTNGGDSLVYRPSQSNTPLCSASGGKASDVATYIHYNNAEEGYVKGGDGGCGGKGAGRMYHHFLNSSSFGWEINVNGANGSNGGDSTQNGQKYNVYTGATTAYSVSGARGLGQGRTTRSFGESDKPTHDNFNQSGMVIIRY